MTEIKPITPAEAGIEIKIISSPRGEVDKDKHEGKVHEWPHIAYTVELWHNGRIFWTGPYKLGVGHVKVPTRGELSTTRAWSYKLMPDEERLLMTWASKPHAQFIDKQRWADVAAKLAISQKVQPKLEGVMHSLLMDGAAHFDSATFEGWCADYGYDTDSRKAEETFRVCEDIGKKLMRALGRDTINGLREWASNY